MNRQSKTILIVTLALMGVTAAWLAYFQSGQALGKPGVKIVAEPTYHEDGRVIGTNSAFLPVKILDCESESVPVAKMAYDWLPKDTTYGQRLYTARDGFKMQINAVVMGRDRTSIHKPQYCLPAAGWGIDERASRLDAVPILRPHSYDLPVMKLIASREAKDENGVPVVRRALYVYWFVADGEVTARHGQRMWWAARDAMSKGVLQRWAYVACQSFCPPGEEEATFLRMKALIAAAVPEFQIATLPPGPMARNP